MAYKLLVVDDEKDVVLLFQDKLTQAGYQVVAAFDGEEALAKVASEKPDIILLDLGLPKVDGFEFLKQIREKYKDKWIPVIVISANADLEAVKKCYGLEADHYLTKPCDIDKVLRGIETMISLMPLRKQGEDAGSV